MPNTSADSLFSHRFLRAADRIESPALPQMSYRYVYANTSAGTASPRPADGVSLVRQVRPAGDALPDLGRTLLRERGLRGIPDSLADKVDGGEIQLVLVDTVNDESWYNRSVHPAVRAARHAQYDAYLRHELVPYIFNRAQRGDLAVYGASFGAYHAANFAARYPDVVSRAICFSGIYDIHAQLDGYWDENCYFNCPTAYIPNMDGEWVGQALARRLGHRHRRARHDRRRRTASSRRCSGRKESRITSRSGAASSATTGRGGGRTCAGSSDARRSAKYVSRGLDRYSCARTCCPGALMRQSAIASPSCRCSVRSAQFVADSQVRAERADGTEVIAAAACGAEPRIHRRIRRAAGRGERRREDGASTTRPTFARFRNDLATILNAKRSGKTAIGAGDPARVLRSSSTASRIDAPARGGRADSRAAVRETRRRRRRRCTRWRTARNITIINAPTGVDRRSARAATGVTVAIIDTGIDYTHPALGGGFGPGFKVIGGWDFVNNDADPMDDAGHGTHVAGIVAGQSDDFTGVAPDASLIAYKVLGANGSGSESNVIAAIERAADPNQDGNTSDHVDVANLSLGGGGNPDDPGSIAIDNATAAGVTFAIAAGNTGVRVQLSHHRQPRHGAQRDHRRRERSRRHHRQLFVARSEHEEHRHQAGRRRARRLAILSSYPGNRYVALSGTSMAVAARGRRGGAAEIAASRLDAGADQAGADEQRHAAARRDHGRRRGTHRRIRRRDRHDPHRSAVAESRSGANRTDQLDRHAPAPPDEQRHAVGDVQRQIERHAGRDSDAVDDDRDDSGRRLSRHHDQLCGRQCANVGSATSFTGGGQIVFTNTASPTDVHNIQFAFTKAARATVTFDRAYPDARWVNDRGRRSSAARIPRRQHVRSADDPRHVGHGDLHAGIRFRHGAASGADFIARKA